MAVSIEDLAPGRNIVDVAAVDAAGNEGPITSIVTYSDTDTPTISIVTPTPGQIVRSSTRFSVIATDSAGITSVRYEVDGVPVGFSTKSPYSLTADLSAFLGGSHTLSAYRHGHDRPDRRPRALASCSTRPCLASPA